MLQTFEKILSKCDPLFFTTVRVSFKLLVIPFFAYINYTQLFQFNYFYIAIDEMVAMITTK